MQERKRLVSTLCLTSSLVLLAAVLAAPIRTSGFVTVSSRPDCLRRNFALPTGESTTRLRAEVATDAVMVMNSLPGENVEQAENEEYERPDRLDEPRVSFPIPSRSRRFPERPPLARRTPLALYPLRC